MGERTSLAITKLYVPCERLAAFLPDAACLLRQREAVLVYGTARMVEQDAESFLLWAQGDFASVIMNLLVRHTPVGLASSAEVFRNLIDLALEHGGPYYPTYHRHATREQLLSGHPRFTEFVRRKRTLDPKSGFGSDWFRHAAGMLDGGPPFVT